MNISLRRTVGGGWWIAPTCRVRGSTTHTKLFRSAQGLDGKPEEQLPIAPCGGWGIVESPAELFAQCGWSGLGVRFIQPSTPAAFLPLSGAGAEGDPLCGGAYRGGAHPAHRGEGVAGLQESAPDCPKCSHLAHGRPHPGVGGLGPLESSPVLPGPSEGRGRNPVQPFSVHFEWFLGGWVEG